MAQHNELSKSLVRHGRVEPSVRPQSDTRRHNFPVPLEAFDREQMGIAAKE